MDKEIFLMIVETIALVIGAVLTRYIIPWIQASKEAKKANAESCKFADFLEFCETIVESANQLYTEEQWRVKKQYVVDLVWNYITSKGVNVTPEEMNGIIEGFVKIVKKANP